MNSGNWSPLAGTTNETELLLPLHASQSLVFTGLRRRNLGASPGRPSTLKYRYYYFAAVSISA
jgi:hypothetical protein